MASPQNKAAVITKEICRTWPLWDYTAFWGFRGTPTRSTCPTASKRCSKLGCQPSGASWLNPTASGKPDLAVVPPLPSRVSEGLGVTCPGVVDILQICSASFWDLTPLLVTHAHGFYRPPLASLSCPISSLGSCSS